MVVSEYFHKYKFVIFTIPILVFLSYGYLTLSGNIRVDLEVLINVPGTTFSWEGIGRMGMVHIERFFKLYIYNRVYFFTLFFIFYTLSIELLMFFCYLMIGKNKKLPIWIFTILLTTSNIMMFQFYFTVQQAEIAVAYFIITVSAFISVWVVRNKLIWYKLTLFFVIVLPVGLCFATYQSFVAYYISLCLLFIILKFENESKVKTNIVLSDGLLVVQFILAMFVYQYINKDYVTSSYLSDSIGWKEGSFINSFIEIILGIIKEVVGWNYSRFSFYLVDVILIIVIIDQFKKKKAKLCADTINKMLHILAFMLTPFMLSVYIGKEAEIRSLFSLPLVASFMGMYLIWTLNTKFSINKKLINRYIPIIFATLQLLMCVQLSYTDYVRYEEDKKFANELYEDILDNVENPLKNIIYIGKRESALNLLCKKIDVFGASMFEYDAYDPSYGGVSRRIQGFMQSQGIYTIYTLPFPVEFYDNYDILSKEMNIYPKEGSIVELNDCIIIKLSEPLY